MSTSTSMPVIKLCCIRRKMHNNNNNNEQQFGLRMVAETVPDWHVAFTGGVASVALSLRCSFCLHLSANAHGDSTDSTTRSLCSGSTWRIPRRLLARATITSNAMHSRQVPWAVGRCVLSLCMLSALKWMALVVRSRVRVLGPC